MTEHFLKNVFFSSEFYLGTDRFFKIPRMPTGTAFAVFQMNLSDICDCCLFAQPVDSSVSLYMSQIKESGNLPLSDTPHLIGPTSSTVDGLFHPSNTLESEQLL